MTHSTVDNWTELQAALGRLLGVETTELRYVSQHGHASNVHRVTLAARGEAPRELIIKKLDDPTYMAFYRDVLRPLDLNSPAMYGEIASDGEQFAVMEFISHRPTRWHERGDYERSIDWLVMKDRLFAREGERVASLPCIRGNWLIEQDFVGPLERGARAGLHARLGPALISRAQEVLAASAASLDAEPHTLCHNDFQLQNVLFAAGCRDDGLFVIDWTWPHVGSRCIDLAMLVHTAPQEMTGQLISRYESQLPMQQFAERLATVRRFFALVVLANMIEFALLGKDDEPRRNYIGELARQVDEGVA
jgi:hypothetical protein